MMDILVVEDERQIAGLLKETLDIEGYRTVAVLNGEDAIQFALHETPHLIILDIMLPGINGYEVIRRLRDHPKTMHIPIIVLSAYASHIDKIHAFELDIDNYITKPFDTDELLARVRSQLRRVQQSSLSPLTKLPGGLQLENAISYKLASTEPWSILYLDLNNFKAFNDVYGFLAGNDMILLVGHICQRVVYEYGNTDDFVGHVGGDDFLIMTTPDRVQLLCQQILTRYKQQSASLYHLEDLERGSISGVDRKGRAYQFPLVSLSIGVVNNQVQHPHNLDEIGMLMAEAKRHAKQSSDNIYSISSQKGVHYHEYPHPSHSDSQSMIPLVEANHSSRGRYHFTEHNAFAEFK